MTVRNKGLAGQQTLVWDAQNRLSQVQDSQGNLAEQYWYDVDGARVKKTSGTTTTYTFFAHYEEEVTGGVTTTVSHYSFGGLRIAVKRGSDLFHLHGDHLGSTSLTTDGAGAATASRAYYAYGAERNSSGDLQIDRTFTGQKRDSTGLMYYNARYYDPALGTFVSPDTLVPDPGRLVDHNRFLYARGNLLKYTDPSGHFVDLLWDAANVAMGINSLVNNIKEGNTGAAIVDGVGVVIDAAALILPIVPSGASTAIRIARATRLARSAENAGDLQAVVRQTDNVVDAGQVAAVVARYDEGYDLVKTIERARSLGHSNTISQTEWLSPAGLYYGKGSSEQHRLLHVLTHAADTTKKKIHGVFHGGRAGFLETIDEAWTYVLEGDPSRVTKRVNGHRTEYHIKMGQEVGYVGGRDAQALTIDQKQGANSMMIVVETGTNHIITAFPVHP